MLESCKVPRSLERHAISIKGSRDNANVQLIGRRHMQEIYERREDCQSVIEARGGRF